VQASVRVVGSPHVTTTGAAPARAVPAVSGETGERGDRPAAEQVGGVRRVPRRTIELVGLALGVAFVAAVALGHELSNDELWQLAAGQWMLAHHTVMGLDPFSYTESHRRWVTDEWGSEVALAELSRWFGAAAYDVYAIVLGGLCLAVSAAYARVVGARGGRVVAIVMLLALGLAGDLVQDRGLDFSLVWFPLELLILAKARTSPRWLLALPPLCLVWVNTHGSVLIGLFVLGVELAWSLVPARAAARLGGVRQSPYTRWLALAGAASVLAACVTPYGPGLLAYDVGVSRNGQIARYIAEWNSPDFHSAMTLLVFLVPLGVLVASVRSRRVPVLEGSLAAILLVEALRTQRLVDYLMLVVVGLAAALPARPPWGATARRWAGAGLVVLAVVILAAPSVPPGTMSPTQPVQAFDWLQSHRGRVFTEYAWGDYSIARHRATFTDGRTDLFEGKVLTEFFDVMNLDTNPDPVLASYDVRYVVWAPSTALGVYLSHDTRWRVVDRSPVALVFART
jgi:hypothetical protein